jgi:hypothetical protein
LQFTDAVDQALHLRLGGYAGLVHHRALHAQLLAHRFAVAEGLLQRHARAERKAADQGSEAKAAEGEQGRCVQSEAALAPAAKPVDVQADHRGTL